MPMARDASVAMLMRVAARAGRSTVAIEISQQPTGASVEGGARVSGAASCMLCGREAPTC
jgi:hypothetical protein